MIDISQLPAVRAQLDRDAAALKERDAERAQELAAKSPRYARAPASTDATPASVRPAATQGNSR